jgi:serine/threonine protein kinase
VIGSEFGRYKVVERLGAGGMGELWKAEDTTLGRSVALKFLAAHLLDDDEAKQRFLREAKAAAAITHPNICHVFEAAEESGKTFLVLYPASWLLVDLPCQMLRGADNGS